MLLECQKEKQLGLGHRTREEVAKSERHNLRQWLEIAAIQMLGERLQELEEIVGQSEFFQLFANPSEINMKKLTSLWARSEHRKV